MQKGKILADSIGERTTKPRSWLKVVRHAESEESRFDARAARRVVAALAAGTVDGGHRPCAGQAPGLRLRLAGGPRRAGAGRAQAPARRADGAAARGDFAWPECGRV